MAGTTGAPGFAIDGRSRLARTRDGGSTWDEPAQGFPPRSSFDSLSFLVTVDFSSTSHGLAGGMEGILRTTNGGATWEKPPFPEGVSVTAVRFARGMIAFAAGTSLRPDGHPTGGVIYQTSDAGATWVKRYQGTSSLSELAISPGGDCFATGEGGLLVISKDGGTSWSENRSMGAWDLKTLAFRDAGVGFLGAGTGDEETEYQGRLFRTNDGGASWRTVTVPGLHTAISHLQFPSAKVGIFLAQGEIYRSLDGGSTWIQSGITPSDGGAILFLSADRGYSLGSEIMKTLDGGLSWRAVADRDGYLRKFNTRFLAMRFTAPGTAYVVGTGGGIVKMTDDASSGVGIRARVDISSGPVMEASLHGKLLRYRMPRPGQVSARLLDLRGRVTSTLFAKTFPPGRQEYQLPEGACGAGLCLLELRVGGIRRTFPVAPSRR